MLALAQYGKVAFVVLGMFLRWMGGETGFLSKGKRGVGDRAHGECYRRH